MQVSYVLDDHNKVHSNSLASTFFYWIYLFKKDLPNQKHGELTKIA